LDSGQIVEITMMAWLQQKSVSHDNKTIFLTTVAMADQN
jgi:hypothetical protein